MPEAKGVDRRLEATLQSPPTSQRIGISATRTGSHQTEIRSHILTLDVDIYVGAGQLTLLTLTTINPPMNHRKPVMKGGFCSSRK